MSIKEEAKLFAIEAHRGQVRKSEPEKPMIIHPINVGMILERYGYDDNVIAAGYLHDVVEDTEHTIEDISSRFGEDIADLVMCASEPDKSLSWEERKTHTIEYIRTLPLRKKLVICADKISNLEDTMILFLKTGKRDFSAFKRGENQQKWYYTNVYESLICGENPCLSIFVELKRVLNRVFKHPDSQKVDEYFCDVYGSREQYKKMLRLHAQKLELSKLICAISLPKPVMVEFCGTPNSGYKSVINILLDFFEKGNIKTRLAPEPLQYNDMTIRDFEKEVYDYYAKEEGIVNGHASSTNDDANKPVVYLSDAWFCKVNIYCFMDLINRRMSSFLYDVIKRITLGAEKENVDLRIITYTDEATAIRKAYSSGITIDKDISEVISEFNNYNKILKRIEPILIDTVEGRCMIIDTAKMKEIDVAIIVAERIMECMRKLYIDALNKAYS